MKKAWQVELSDMNEMELKRLQKRIDKQIESIKKYNFKVDRITCEYSESSYKNYILYLGVDQQRANQDHPSIANKEIYRSKNINEVLAYIQSLKETLSKAEGILMAVKAE